MSYFSGQVDPDDYEDGYTETSSRKSRLKLNLTIFLVVLVALSSTYAANISLGGARKEFGQGVYQIKACDQWVGVQLQTAASPDNAYVGTVKLYGFDPRLCVGRIFNIKLFKSGSAAAMDLYLGAGATSGTDTASVLTIMDTSTPYSSSYPTRGTKTAFETWSSDALTLVDKFGRNIGYQDSYLNILYYPKIGSYWIEFTYPKAEAALVTGVTIESACYTLPATSCR
jgi:hypothetical protein